MRTLRFKRIEMNVIFNFCLIYVLPNIEIFLNSPTRLLIDKTDENARELVGSRAKLLIIILAGTDFLIIFITKLYNFHEYLIWKLQKLLKLPENRVRTNGAKKRNSGFISHYENGKS